MPAKLLFKGGLKPAFADDVVHSVNAVVKLFVLFLKNDARHADDVRRGVSVRVLADIAFNYVNALKIIAVLAYYVHRRGGNVLCKGIGRVVVIAHSFHFIAHARRPAKVGIAHILQPIALFKAKDNVLHACKFRKVKVFAKALLRRFASGIFPGRLL